MNPNNVSSRKETSQFRSSRIEEPGVLPRSSHRDVERLELELELVVGARVEESGGGRIESVGQCSPGRLRTRRVGGEVVDEHAVEFESLRLEDGENEPVPHTLPQPDPRTIIPNDDSGFRSEINLRRAAFPHKSKQLRLNVPLLTHIAQPQRLRSIYDPSLLGQTIDAVGKELEKSEDESMSARRDSFVRPVIRGELKDTRHRRNLSSVLFQSIDHRLEIVEAKRRGEDSLHRVAEE